jgi:hypothetical protein
MSPAFAVFPLLLVCLEFYALLCQVKRISWNEISGLQLLNV